MSDAPKWLVQAATQRAELDVPREFRPWTSDPSFKGTGVSRGKRALEMLDLGFMHTCKRAKRNFNVVNAKQSGALDSSVVDISQNPCRKPWNLANGCAHTLTTSTLM